MRVLLNGHEYRELIKSKEVYKKEAYAEVYKQLNDNQDKFFGEVAKLMHEYLGDTKYAHFQAMNIESFELRQLREKFDILIKNYKLEIPK